jgi:hypothetical protein
MDNILFTWGVDWFGNATLQINLSNMSSDPNVQATQQAQIQAAIQEVLGQ